ncbi:MAG: hypothetical protein U0359_12100 [Byssovorax sp.]
MTMAGLFSATEARLRDALVAAMIPAPGAGLPAAADVDLRAFWPRFEAAAPLHLRLGFRASVLALGALPLALGYGRSLADLDDDAREAFLQRASALPGMVALLDVAKIVVGLAYFADPGVEAIVRGAP